MKLQFQQFKKKHEQRLKSLIRHLNKKREIISDKENEKLFLDEIQQLRTNGAHGVESVNLRDDLYLAIPNFGRDGGTSVYRWENSAGAFQQFQLLPAKLSVAVDFRLASLVLVKWNWLIIKIMARPIVLSYLIDLFWIAKILRKSLERNVIFLC